ARAGCHPSSMKTVSPGPRTGHVLPRMLNPTPRSTHGRGRTRRRTQIVSQMVSRRPPGQLVLCWWCWPWVSCWRPVLGQPWPSGDNGADPVRAREWRWRAQRGRLNTNCKMQVLRPRHSGLVLKAVKGAGMPIHQDPFNFGNLFLVVTLLFPEAMPETVTAPLRRMLGAEETRSENMEDLEEVFCEDLDPLQSAKASKKVTTQAYDEDDERHGLECKQQ
ncbi:Chaperone protein dnaJ 2 (AtDjA2), partial [Durusdinium trenchii]